MFWRLKIEIKASLELLEQVGVMKFIQWIPQKLRTNLAVPRNHPAIHNAEDKSRISS